MKSLDTLPKEGVRDFVMSCYDAKSGGFAAFPGHDAHVLTTLSGLQVLLTYDMLSALLAEQKRQTIEFVLDLRLADGSFKGDGFGEVDTRFVFVGCYILTILEAMTDEIAESACNFIIQCRAFDGGFGLLPGAESHAAQVYTCVGCLALCDGLDRLDDSTATWLSERQVLPSGGFNGRPEKLPDVCYSWWVLLSLAILNKLSWISTEKVEEFILECQNVDTSGLDKKSLEEIGGFSDRPGNQTDVYHTCFALAGLSLLLADKHDLEEVDPILCMPKFVASRIKLYKRS